MLSISAARSQTDFETAEELCTGLGRWDAEIAPSYGVSSADVVALFHGEDRISLAKKFGADDARFLIARWEQLAAGSLAFNAFDEHCSELHHFYVDSKFRGMGIGQQLMRTALTEISQGSRRRILIHTTPYMTHAVAIYERFGFRSCARFRDTPENIRHTDLFMDMLI